MKLTYSMQLSKLLLAIFVGGLSTQLSASEKVSSLKSITVTATREAEEVSKQALSIAKKSAEEVALDQVMFQKDLLNSIAGT
ncbi:hypothetical protein MNBD_GAMMA04-1037 [hydrothermal vent metagenome]|uniref:Uncharacterized protein n=1 Tax=hydrothermal vent metagenome TaxID=652676 RepID=A0A3B0WK71_9ZZZZ